jgi:hypothetical protein
LYTWNVSERDLVNFIEFYCRTPEKDGEKHRHKATKRNAKMIANKKIAKMMNDMEEIAQQVKDLQMISTASMVPSVMIPFPPFGQKEENSNSRTQSDPKEGQQHTIKQRVLIISKALLKPPQTDWNEKSVCLEYPSATV